MTESQLARQILDTLRKRGGVWFKTHGSAYQVAGLPDIIGCYRGRFVGMEIKLPGKENTLSKRQRFFLSRIQSNGGTSGVVTSKRGASQMLDDIDSQL